MPRPSTTFSSDRHRRRRSRYIRKRFTTAHQEQRQNDRFGGDFATLHQLIISGEYERATPPSGVVTNAPVPLFFTIKGPPTIRRMDGESGSRPYVVSNGGNPLEITEGIS